MKKTLVALAALSAIAGAAQAQSTVTIYGLFDTAFISQQSNTANAALTATNGAVAGTQVIQGITKNTFIDGGAGFGSRLGFKGSEDLGGGLSAIFNLEAGINPYAGSSSQGATLFGRRSIAGFSSTSWGTVGVGRNSSPFDDVAADHAMMKTGIFDPSITNNAPQALVTNGVNSANTFATTMMSHDRTTWVGYSTRFNNSFKYQTPVWGGFSAAAMWATGADNNLTTDATQTISANAKYEQGPLKVSLGYQSEALGGTEATTAYGVLTDKGIANTGNTANTLVGKNPNSASTVTGALAGLKPALENTLISAAYDMGFARFGVGYNQAKFKDVLVALSSTTAAAISNQNEYNLSVAVPFGATTLSAGYAVSQGDSLGKASGYGIMAEYALSKRTELYAGYSNTTTYDNLSNYYNAHGSSIAALTNLGFGLQHKF